MEPTVFLHCLQGWPPAGPNHFRWKNNTLLYSHWVGRTHHELTVTPTAEQWADFWNLCDEIEIWSWPPYLGNRAVFDGLQWIINFEVGSRRVASEGQVHDSPPGTGEKLMRVHRALQAMTGYVEPEDAA